MTEQLVLDAGGLLGISGEPGRRVYTAAMPVRWSDQDLYHHVNHARMITLIEEARIPWLFEDGIPTATLAAGAVMTDLNVKYRGQVKHADGPIRVRMWCEKVGGALMVARHEVRGVAHGDVKWMGHDSPSRACEVAYPDAILQHPAVQPAGTVLACNEVENREEYEASQP